MSGSPELPYIGKELDLFAHAQNWKHYWAGLLAPYLRGDVLEAGAGLGVNTRLLRTENQRRWVCLEPDATLLDRFGASLKTAPLIAPCELRVGTVASLDASELFDVILYIDVLEHIADDAGELRQAAAHLRTGGRLIVLSPAHGWLFSEFDAAIGHHRRYNRKSLRAAGEATPQLHLERLIYLDSCGLIASTANRLLLRQSMPTLRQILFWDRTLVPCSRLLDPLLLRGVGKSIVGIWIK
jgi:SAM-dependent methyltransferase